MATFTEIYYNGNEYKEMWLNGSKIWEKASGGGEIIYPYPDCDSVITYMNKYSYDRTPTFEIIDGSLPYSINGITANSYVFPSGSETQVKLVNLKPTTDTGSDFYPTNIEQLRIPSLTDLKKILSCVNIVQNGTTWQPQYFEFNKYPTTMAQFLSGNFYTTDEMLKQFAPYFPNTSNVTDMSFMFSESLYVTSWDIILSKLDTRKVTNISRMFQQNEKLTSIDLSKAITTNLKYMSFMFYRCTSLKEIDLMNFDTRKVVDYTSVFKGVTDCNIYIGENWTLGTSSTLGEGSGLNFIYKIIPITSITKLVCKENINNITKPKFEIEPICSPTVYSYSDLEIIYDSTYMSIYNNEVTLKDGCQGLTHTVTYRSKTDNSISKSITFRVSQDLICEELNIDFTQSTAPTLPSYMTLDGQGSSYYFSHGTCTTNIYGLVPNNSDLNSTIAYTRYKYVAPKDGVLTFTYRCYSEANYDYFIIHVDSSTSQPSYSSSTNRLVYNSGGTYATTDGTASVNVTSGTTYYIHIQYRKDSSGHVGYDKGCIRKIELL